eukprot:17558_4
MMGISMISLWPYQITPNSKYLNWHTIVSAQQGLRSFLMHSTTMSSTVCDIKQSTPKRWRERSDRFPKQHISQGHGFTDGPYRWRYRVPCSFDTKKPSTSYIPINHTRCTSQSSSATGFSFCYFYVQWNLGGFLFIS